METNVIHANVMHQGGWWAYKVHQSLSSHTKSCLCTSVEVRRRSWFKLKSVNTLQNFPYVLIEACLIEASVYFMAAPKNRPEINQTVQNHDRENPVFGMHGPCSCPIIIYISSVLQDRTGRLTGETLHCVLNNVSLFLY